MPTHSLKKVFSDTYHMASVFLDADGQWRSGPGTYHLVREREN